MLIKKSFKIYLKLIDWFYCRVGIRIIGDVNGAKWREEVGWFGCGGEPPMMWRLSDGGLERRFRTVVVMIEHLKTFDLKGHEESQPRDLRGRTIGYYLWAL